jgi:hypothetical protein
MALTDEVLSQLKQDESEGADGPNLSLNAIRGTAKETCMRVRALVGNQTMLILVDSGSSTSFINKIFVERGGEIWSQHFKQCDQEKSFFTACWTALETVQAAESSLDGSPSCQLHLQ